MTTSIFLAPGTITLFLQVCSDGMGFYTHGRRNWSPVTAVIMNLPPLTRTTFGAMLLLGVLPEHVKDYNGLVRALYEPYRALGMIAGVGQGDLPVFNAFTGTELKVFVEVLIGTEDSKGLPRLLGHHGSGYIGGCPYCDQEGYRCAGSQYYPGFLAFVASRYPARLCRQHMKLGLVEEKVPDHNPKASEARASYPRHPELQSGGIGCG